MIFLNFVKNTILIPTWSIIKKLRYGIHPKKILVGHFLLETPTLHQLENYLKIPTYSRNLPRIVSYMSQMYTDFKVIDIGANIGDTVALIYSETKKQFSIVCIEGDENYFQLLKKNVQQFEHVNIYKYLLAENDETKTGALETLLGSGEINESATGNLETLSLDSFLKKYPEHIEARVLKIDTDGYDIKILYGAKKFLSEKKPVIFFEFDRRMIEEKNDNGLSALRYLRDIGYQTIFFYDHKGRLLLTTTLEQEGIIEDLYRYTYNKLGAFPYYDLCIFHGNDQKLAYEIKKKEVAFYENII